MDSQESTTWMDEHGDDLKQKAERLFRLECIETLSWPPCSMLPKEIISQNPSEAVHDVTKNLENNVLTPMEPSTSINPQIDSLGNIIDFVEESRTCEEFGSSTVSMSINRAPFKHGNVVMNAIRGSSSNVPFLPGFDEDLDDLLSGSQSNQNGTRLNDELKFLNFEDSTLLKTVPVIGDVVFIGSAANTKIAKHPDEAIIDLDSSDMFDLIDFVSSGTSILPVFEKVEKELKSDEPTSEETVNLKISDEEKSSDEKENAEIDECVSVPLSIRRNSTDDDEEFNITGGKGSGEFAFANKVEMKSEDYDEYKQLLPTMTRKYPFELDPFQQASVLCMERGESLFVAAHTSAGKTVVAEYAIAMCKAHKTRAIYTSPIKALSNQKFRDFKQIFDDVGLVTGDIQLHPEAFCLIMTTEILRSMLYNGSEVIRDLEWVVFDEVHYINNEERGHVWEEVFIMLPAHVKIVMLSATVPNCVEFADWVGRIKNRRINVISTNKRPVPLEHFLYTGQDGKTQKDLFKIIDRNGDFLMKGWNDAKEAKQRINEKNMNMNDNNAGAGGGAARGGRGGAPFRGGNGQDRGRGRGGRHPNHGGSSNSGKNWPGKNDKNIYLNLINFMKFNDQLPLVAFVFSRKRCDDNAQLLKSMDLTSEVEKSHVHKFFAQCIERLKGSDKELPQVLTMKELCLRGFAVHHSGILPILKEVVELLFQRGYVKILFATETFAMGVNMPARCVVFDSIVKHDGTQRRILNPGEYTQMAGRAGRRGLDSTGTVIVLCKEAAVPQYDELKNLMSGSALRLESKFRVTYSMLLNLLRVEQLKIEDMLQRSYVESNSLREAKERKKKLKDITNQLQAMNITECAICTPTSSPNGIVDGLRSYHDALAEFAFGRSALWPRLNGENSINKLLVPGRVLIVSSAPHGLQNEAVVLLKELINGSTRSLQVMVCASDHDECQEKLREYDAFINSAKSNIWWLNEENTLLGVAKFGTNGVNLHSNERQYFRVCEIGLNSILTIVKKTVKSFQNVEIVQEYNMKMLPRFRDQEVSDTSLKILQQLSSFAVGLAKNTVEVYSMAELVKLCSNIELSDDTAMIASIEIELDDINNFPARHCTRFDEHFTALRNRVRIERAASKLTYELSSDALLLSEDYQNRLRVLEQLEYVESDKLVSLKGRIACEIHHQELLITELILDYKFHQRPPADLAALLSTLTCQYNSGKELKFEESSVFHEIRESVNSVMSRLEAIAVRHGAQIAEIGCEIRFDLMEVVYHWASGMPFSKIMEMTDCQEGLIVKCIQRLDEVCKDVRNAGRIVGDPALVEKMEEVSASIRRDIVFAASLYTSV